MSKNETGLGFDSGVDAGSVDSTSSGTLGVRDFFRKCRTKALGRVTFRSKPKDGYMSEDPLEQSFDDKWIIQRGFVSEDPLDNSDASSMSIHSWENGTPQMIEDGQLVIKNTFLELAVPDNGAESEGEAKATTRSKNKNRRSVTDTVVDYGDGAEDSTSCGEASDMEVDGQPLKCSQLSSTAEDDEESGGEPDNEPDLVRTISYASTANGSDVYEPSPWAEPMSLQPQPQQTSFMIAIPFCATPMGLSQACPSGPQQDEIRPGEQNVRESLVAAEFSEQAARLNLAALQLEYAALCVRQGQEPTTQAATTTNSGRSWADMTDVTSESVSPELTHMVSVSEEWRTTVMLRHLPEGYTRAALLELLESQGFQGSYDFVYLPVDFVKWKGFGYAFINMVCHEDARRVWKHFDGFKDWPAHPDIQETGEAPRACEVSWGDPLQGLKAHFERYRNSPVMHKDVPEHFKPVTFSKGVKVKFPPPTKRIRPPRLKHGNPADSIAH
jgi:hypothetical protein